MHKILITIGGYLPGQKYGGPVTSVSNFVELLGNDFEIFIITSNHELGDRTRYKDIIDGWNNVGLAKVLYLEEKEMMKASILNRIIKEIAPDVIYHNGLYDYRFTLPITKLSKRKTLPPIIFVPRGDLGPVYPERKKIIKKIYVNFIRMFLSKRTFFQATSLDEKKDITNRLDVCENKVFLLENIPSYPNNDVDCFVKKSAGELKLLYFARVHPTKNLSTALLALKNVKGHIEFDIYGGIESDEYWNNCKSIINSLPNNIIVRYNGVASHDCVYELYKKHHALLFPTRNKENYGHTIVESILANRPVIISDQSPWNDVAECNAGWVFSGDATNDFSKAIQLLTDLDQNAFNVIVNNVKSYKKVKFSKEEIKKKYIKMIDEVIA